MLKKIITLSFMLLSICFYSQESEDFKTKLDSKDIKYKFLSEIDGTRAKGKELIKSSFIAKEITDKGMIPIGVNPEIYVMEGKCIRFTLTDEDGDKRAYILCSENNKISTFDLDWDWEEE